MQKGIHVKGSVEAFCAGKIRGLFSWAVTWLDMWSFSAETLLKAVWKFSREP